MIDYTPQLQQILLFVVAGGFGVLYAYCWKWVELKDPIPLFKYLFGNKKETLRVLLIFISTVVGTIGLDYLSNLTNFQILAAGCSLGLLIPQKVSESINKGE